MKGTMRWASTLSVDPRLERAVEEGLAGLARTLEGAPPDLVVVFVSPHHQDGWAGIPAAVTAAWPGALTLGCSAGGVIGGGREVEEGAGLSFTAARLPGVELRPLRVDPHSAAQVIAGGGDLEGKAGATPGEKPGFLLLSDPFSFDAEGFLRAIDAAFPGSPKAGGLASGGGQPGANALFLGPDVYPTGLVGVVLRGALEIDTIVAQGCKPIGDPMFVTRARGNLLLEVDGLPPVEVLRDLFGRLEPGDRKLFRHSLFLGLVMDEARHEYRQGDFLIRNLVGIDEEAGALAIGATLHEGTVVQFHLRDARTSAEDLDLLLARHAREAPPASGSLLFSCLGRGKGLYGHAGHDSESFRRNLGDVPLGGFFCNGEIGPVQGRTHLHGYTSSFALFRPR